MPKDIRLSALSRLIRASDLRLHGTQKNATPIDFASDHIIVLDGDSRPVAECWPIEREATEPARTAVVSVATLPGPKLAEVNGAPPLPTSRGPLSEAQRELLARLWTEHPEATVDHIGELFERKTHRVISALTVSTYKPRPAGKPVV